VTNMQRLCEDPDKSGDEAIQTHTKTAHVCL